MSLLRDDSSDSTTRIPTHLYYKSPSSWTTRTQLAIRTGQFLTAYNAWRRNLTTDPRCTYCGYHYQDLRHLFRDCPFFADIRQQWRTRAITKCERSHDADYTQRFVAYIDQLLQHELFWVGHVPNNTYNLDTYDLQSAHYMATTLTARIASVKTIDDRKQWHRDQQDT